MIVWACISVAALGAFWVLLRPRSRPQIMITSWEGFVAVGGTARINGARTKVTLALPRGFAFGPLNGELS